MGIYPPAAVFAWIIFAAGLASLLLRKQGSFLSRLTVAGGITGFLMLAVATNRSQYISARYFSPLMPVLYIIFAAGLSGIARLLFKPTVARPVLFGATGILLLIHMTVFLPPYYRLTAKSVDFGEIAQLLNRNLSKKWSRKSSRRVPKLCKNL